GAHFVAEFGNDRRTDFTAEANRKAFADALAGVEARLPLQGKNHIGGKEVGAANSFESVNPCKKSQVIGRFPEGTKEDAVAAVDAAAKAFPSWSRPKPQERSNLLVKIPKILRDRKHEYFATMCPA